MADIKFDASIADALIGEGDTTTGESPIRFDPETSPDTSLSALLDEIDNEPEGGEPEAQIDETLKKFMAKYGNDPAKIAEAALESQKRMNKVARDRNQYERDLQERDRVIRELRSSTVQVPQGRQATPQDVEAESWDEIYQDPNKFFSLMDRRVAEITQSVLQNARQQEQQRQVIEELKKADMQFEDDHSELSIEEVEGVKRFAERRGIRHLEDAYRSILSLQKVGGNSGNSGKDNRAAIARLTRPRTLRSGSGGGIGSGSTNIEEVLQKVANGSLDDYAKLSPAVQKRIQYMLARGGLPEE